MMESGGYNELANTWPSVTPKHYRVPAWLLAVLRVLGKGLRATMPLMAGIYPVYTIFDVVLREFHQRLDPVSCLALAGIGTCFIYFPSYITCPPERRLSMITALLIGFGFVVGLVEVWICT